MNCCRTVGDTPTIGAHNEATVGLSGFEAQRRCPIGSTSPKNIVTNC